MNGESLTRLVGSTPEFAAQIWGRRPLLVSGASGRDGWPDLLTLDGVDELLSVRGLRTPFLRLAKNGVTLDAGRFTRGGGVGAGIADQVADDEVFRRFADGFTIVLQALHRTWPPIVAFAQDLAGDLGHPVQVNAYITPPQSRGFSPHFDVHDVFVLQLAGTKEWTVHEPVHRWPTRDQSWDHYADQVAARATEQPALSAVLAPGDCLYLPRGFIHSAVAQGGVSAHLTIGIHAWTELDVTRSLLDAALGDLTADQAARAPLPLGVVVDRPGGLNDALDRVRERLVEALRAVDDAQIATRLATRVRATQRGEPVRPVALAGAVAALDAWTPLRLRRHLALRDTTRDDGSLALRGRGVDVVVPASDVETFHAMPRERPFTVADLVHGSTPEWEQPSQAGVVPAPGVAPEAAAVELCRRLMLAGVLVPAGESPTGDADGASDAKGAGDA